MNIQFIALQVRPLSNEHKIKACIDIIEKAKAAGKSVKVDMEWLLSYINPRGVSDGTKTNFNIVLNKRLRHVINPQGSAK